MSELANPGGRLHMECGLPDVFICSMCALQECRLTDVFICSMCALQESGSTDVFLFVPCALQASLVKAACGSQGGYWP